LARGPIFTFVTYQGYDINGYTFYIEQQENKSTYQNNSVSVDAYEVTGKDKNMYYGQSLTFTVSGFPFSVATGLMQSRVLYKTSTSSLVLTLTIKDKSRILLC
jgi:hypothetical protein